MTLDNNLVNQQEKQKPISSKVGAYKVFIMLGFISFLLLKPDTVFGDSDSVSFRRDVMAVLSKAGCNMGACHGNKNGKYGFKLSLRGENPTFDFESITSEYDSRRINKWIPEASLILTKATTELAHEGGRRFQKDSKYYQILHDWINSGAKDDDGEWIKPIDLQLSPSESHFIYEPDKEISIRVTAEFANGLRKDVSDMAVYETSNNLVKISDNGLVTFLQPGETTIIIRYLDIQKPLNLVFVPRNENYQEVSKIGQNFIDTHIYKKLVKLKQTPSSECSDATYLRRVSMDLTGLPPTPSAIDEFLNNNDPDKKHKLVIDLMETREFSEFWASKWADLLRVEEKVLDRKGVRAFYQWIQTSIATHKPLDQFAREIIRARGSTYKNPATNFFRANRTATQRAVATAQVFLGTRLQCAECHNHPFDKWTQNDYYSWASAFASIKFKILQNNRRDGLDKNEFIGEQVLYDNDQYSIENPTSKQLMAARVLGGKSNLPIGSNRKSALAEWLVSSDNKQFARVQANRIWSHLMGRGLVEPVDDFRSTNPPSHPELLDNLTDYFIDSGYQIRPLIALIISSEAYQRSSEKIPENIFDDPINYARNIPRRFTGEQILDAQSQALMVDVEFNGYAPGTRASQIPGVMAIRTRSKVPSGGDKFLKVFGKSQRMLSTDEERTCDPNITQAFQLISSPLIHKLITDSDNIINQLIQEGESNHDRLVEELYLRFLSRRPQPSERAHFSDYLNKPGKTQLREAIEDITWSLINSKEFLFRY